MASVQTAELPHQTFNIGVKAVIVQRGRVLFLKRRDHDVWELPGGRINQGDEIEDTLRRELQEELPQSTHSRVHEILHAQQADFTLPNGARLMLLFFRVSITLPQDLELSDEHEQARWASAAELRSLNLQPHFLHAALCALQGNY